MEIRGVRDSKALVAKIKGRRDDEKLQLIKNKLK